MNLEPTAQGEAKLKREDKYHILTHIYGIQKDGTDEPLCRGAIEMQIQKTRLVDTVGKGEGEMN